jgi:hypothetical protein
VQDGVGGLGRNVKCQITHYEHGKRTRTRNTNPERRDEGVSRSKSIFPCTINWLQKIHVEKPGNSGILKTAGDLWEHSCTLVTACAIVPAADDAVFGLPEIESGIFPVIASLFFCVQSRQASALSFYHQKTRSAPEGQICDSCA